ncbi:MAG: fasciclin domain-containing protein [Rhodobacteraceae bacterium]|nr:fasciclin domain-containing protein [Paracoccaceae bacterium]
MNTTLKATAAALALSLVSAAANAGSIVDIAVGDERFSTLVTAVTAAGLAETLSGPGPFTVFAPVNDAFAALPEGTVETLLKPDMKGDLSNMLLYHVVGGAVMAGDIAMGTSGVGTLAEGAKVCVTKSGEGVMLDDGTGKMANVVVADIVADNGVIHVIDKVILPGNAPACM